MYGFIILRHVNNLTTDLYWRECYKCIRRFYPDNRIVIIDDNSNPEFLTMDADMTNVTIIESKYKQRGELLPYLYYAKHKWFDKAIIIHDSVFIQQYVDFDKFENQPLWHFANDICSLEKEQKHIIRCARNSDRLMKLYERKRWAGCFGCMSVITYKAIRRLNRKFKLRRFIKRVKCRQDRMCMERIIGVMFYYLNKKSSVFGSIMEYCKWGYSFDDYTKNKLELPFIKVWTGR
jgi:hypothetical protein